MLHVGGRRNDAARHWTRHTDRSGILLIHLVCVIADRQDLPVSDGNHIPVLHELLSAPVTKLQSVRSEVNTDHI